MAEKVFVPRQKQDYWDDYWQKSDFTRELSLCKTDGLLPVFDTYLTKKQTIIEAGCGMGKWVIYLGRKGYNITGVDNNVYALKSLKKFEPKAQTKQADVESMPYEDESIDVYVSLGVVEHIETGPDQALSEAYRIVKPGGLAIVEVPFDNLLRQAMRILPLLKKPARVAAEIMGLKKKRQLPAMDFYEYHYTLGELKGFLSRAGFSVIDWFPKDDLDENKSIGLWLDFPKLRQNRDYADFTLNQNGRKIKRILNGFHLQSLYSGCVVCVARKL